MEDTVMGTLTHKAARAAFSTAIDQALKHIYKDREKGLLDIVDISEKFLGDTFGDQVYDNARKSGCSILTGHWMRSILMWQR